MQNKLKFVTLITVASVCLMITVIAGTFLYVRYGGNPSKVEDLESRLRNLEGTTVKLSSNNEHFLRVGRFNISTSDRVEPQQRINFRIPYGTNDTKHFTEGVFKATSNIKAIWVSEWSPRTEMMKFEEFKVSPAGQSTSFELIAKPITNASISMDFEVTVILE
jgi:hypothetical protein